MREESNAFYSDVSGGLGNGGGDWRERLATRSKTTTTATGTTNINRISARMMRSGPARLKKLPSDMPQRVPIYSRDGKLTEVEDEPGVGKCGADAQIGRKLLLNL